MVRHVNYAGLKHYTTGNTRLTVKENTLDVTGTDHVLDGILIDTAIANQWAAELRPFSIQPNTIFGATFNQFDKEGSKTISQWLVTQSPDKQFAYLLVNSKLEGHQISVSGYLEGRRIFDLDNYTLAGFADWKIAVIFDIARHPITINQVGYSSPKETLASVTKSIGISGWVLMEYNRMQISHRAKKPQPTLMQVDNIRIESSNSSPMDMAVSQVVFSGKDITPFAILEENYTTV